MAQRIDSIYAALLSRRESLGGRGLPGEPDAGWIIDDNAFTDAWCDIDARQLLINYLEEWLGDQSASSPTTT